MKAIKLILVCFLISGCNQEAETTSPRKEQVNYARKFLSINPDLKIEPLGFLEHKDPMETHLMFKFIVKTEDSALLFDDVNLNADDFQKNVHSPTPPSFVPEWWKTDSQPLIGVNLSSQ